MGRAGVPERKNRSKGHTRKISTGKEKRLSGLPGRMSRSQGELVPVRTNGAAEFPPHKSAPSMFWCVILWEQSTVWESLPFAVILSYQANKTEFFLNILMNKKTQKQLRQI